MPIFGFGSGDGVSVLGGLGEHKCPKCRETVNFSVRAAYRYVHFLHILSFLVQRVFFVQCDHCLLAKPVEKSLIREQFPSDRIPFIRKNGWLLVLAAAVVLAGYAWVDGELNRRRLADLVENPLVNDVYLANLAKVKGSGFDQLSNDVLRMGGYAWGGMKLLKVQEDRLVFATTASAYAKKPGRESIMRRETKFDLENPVAITRREVGELISNGIIYDIRRR